MNSYDYGLNITMQSEGLVYDSKYGYMEPKKLEKKRLRWHVNALSFLPVIMYTLMFLFSAVSIRIVYADGLYSSAYSETSGIPPLVYYTLQLFSTPFSIFLPFFIYAAASKKVTMNEVIRVNNVKLSDKLLIIFAGLAICLLANLPASWLGNFLSNYGYHSSSSSSYTPTTPILMLLYFIETAIMPPVFEEFAFRGVILGSLRKYGDFFALVTSAFIFGCMHMSVTSSLFAFIAGLAMGYAYIITGNIWVNIGIHFCNNAISVILDLLDANCSETIATIGNIAIFYGAIILGIVCLVVLIAKKKLPLRLYKPEKKISAVSKLECTVFNPGFICFLIMVGGVTTMNYLGIY